MFSKYWHAEIAIGWPIFQKALRHCLGEEGFLIFHSPQKEDFEK